MTKNIKRLLVGFGVLILLAILFVAALAIDLVAWHNQSLLLPSPTGSYRVGRTEYDWTDESRIDALSDHANEKRRLLIWVWYPAASSGQTSSALYLPPAWVKAHDKDQGIGKLIESNFLHIQTHSSADAPLAKSQSAYPVIIMQPGMGPVPTDYTVLAENLASHGYVVVAINPTYTSNVIVFPDGRIAMRSQMGQIPDNADAITVDQDANRIEKVWADDVAFGMDRLRSLNGDPASLFYNKLDLARIGIFGHSFGGATAFRVCKQDVRCKAGADLDGTLWGDDLTGSQPQAFMFMTEEECGSDCKSMRQMYSTAKSAAYYLSIKGAKHFNFSDLPLRWSPLARVLLRQLGFIGSIQPERGLEISNAYLVAFFDRNLKGADSELLQGPSSAYPEVQFKKR